MPLMKKKKKPNRVKIIFVLSILSFYRVFLIYTRTSIVYNIRISVRAVYNILIKYKIVFL